MIVQPGRLLVAGLLALGSFAFADEPHIPPYLEKDFREFNETFAGLWSNDRHVFFAEAGGLGSEGIAPRQLIEITRDETYETEAASIRFRAIRQIDGEDPTELHHTFRMDPVTETILHAFSLPDGTPTDCEVSWEREGGQFRGTASGEECASVFSRVEGDAPLRVVMSLSETELWVKSQRGDFHSEARFRRARPFECWAAVMRGAEHGDSAEGMSDWDFRRGITLHDQGGEARFVTDEDPARTVKLRLRDVEWTYGTNRPSLTLYVMEGDSDRAVSYAWTEAGADRIGINLRWMQASCTHAAD